MTTRRWWVNRDLYDKIWLCVNLLFDNLNPVWHRHSSQVHNFSYFDIVEISRVVFIMSENIALLSVTILKILLICYTILFSETSGICPTTSSVNITQWLTKWRVHESVPSWYTLLVWWIDYTEPGLLMSQLQPVWRKENTSSETYNKSLTFSVKPPTGLVVKQWIPSRTSVWTSNHSWLVVDTSRSVIVFERILSKINAFCLQNWGIFNI